MFGRWLNGLKQGSEAAKAVAIIQQITGIKADELMITNLRSRSQINQQSCVSMNAHEYAFEVMFTYYVDLADSYPALRKKWITKEHPLRKKILESFDAFVALGIIRDSYIIGEYERAKLELVSNRLNQGEQLIPQSDAPKSTQSDAIDASSLMKPAESPKAVLGALDSTINHRRFLVNEKVVPKGTPAFSGKLEGAPEAVRRGNKQVNPPASIESKEVKTLSIKYRCPACQVEISKSKLLKSEVGIGWKKCPFCETNFQI